MQEPRRTRWELPEPEEITKFRERVQRFFSPPAPPREIKDFDRKVARFYTPKW